MTQKKKLIILDCDGTLYAPGNIPLPSIKRALFETCQDFGISQDRLERASALTRNKFPGLMNFVLRICNNNKADFKAFSTEMSKRINYNQILPDPKLLSSIKNLSQQAKVCIFTNNSRAHLDNVLQALFKKESKNIGIPCFSIEDTFDNGWFNPKQSDKGLLIICNKMGVAREDALLMDDTPFILRQAQSQGLRTKQVISHHDVPYYLNKIQKEHTRV